MSGVSAVTVLELRGQPVKSTTHPSRVTDRRTAGPNPGVSVEVLRTPTIDAELDGHHPDVAEAQGWAGVRSPFRSPALSG